MINNTLIGPKGTQCSLGKSTRPKSFVVRINGLSHANIYKQKSSSAIEEQKLLKTTSVSIGKLPLKSQHLSVLSLLLYIL